MNNSNIPYLPQDILDLIMYERKLKTQLMRITASNTIKNYWIKYKYRFHLIGLQAEILWDYLEDHIDVEYKIEMDNGIKEELFKLNPITKEFKLDTIRYIDTNENNEVILNLDSKENIKEVKFIYNISEIESYNIDSMSYTFVFKLDYKEVEEKSYNFGCSYHKLLKNKTIFLILNEGDELEDLELKINHKSAKLTRLY